MRSDCMACQRSRLVIPPPVPSRYFSDGFSQHKAIADKGEVKITSYLQTNANLCSSSPLNYFVPKNEPLDCAPTVNNLLSKPEATVSSQDMRAEAEQQIYEKLNQKIGEFLDLGKNMFTPATLYCCHRRCCRCYRAGYVHRCCCFHLCSCLRVRGCFLRFFLV